MKNAAPQRIADWDIQKVLGMTKLNCLGIFFFFWRKDNFKRKELESMIKLEMAISRLLIKQRAVRNI